MILDFLFRMFCSKFPDRPSALVVKNTLIGWAIWTISFGTLLTASTLVTHSLPAGLHGLMAVGIFYLCAFLLGFQAIFAGFLWVYGIFIPVRRWWRNLR